MKKRLLLIAAALAFAGTALAQGASHWAKGTVKRTDAERGKVTIAHEPVQSLRWPSMTMVFTVKDKALLDKLQKDQKIDFEFTQEGKDYVVTKVK